MRTKVRLLPLLAVVPATPSLADRPRILEFDASFLDPFATEACGSPVLVRVQGRLVVRVEGGSETISSAQYSNTFTNLNTGRQVVLQFSGQQGDSFDLEDGRIVFTSREASRIVVPGMGAVSINAGQIEEDHHRRPGDLRDPLLRNHTDGAVRRLDRRGALHAPLDVRAAGGVPTPLR